MADPIQTAQLSRLGQQALEVECERCTRRGRYRPEKLIAELGDVSVTAALEFIARRSGCQHADCAIRRVSTDIRAPTLYVALHRGWRVFLSCERRRQALKATRPCPGECELDVATLIAGLGHDVELERLPRLLVAPCCGSRALSLRWVKPAPTLRVA